MRIRITGRALFSLLLTLILVWFVVTATGYNATARFVPLVVGIPTLLLAVYQVQADLRRAPKASKAKAPGSEEGGSEIGKELNSILWIVSCFVLIWLIGLEWGLPLYSLAYAKVRGKQPWLLSLVPAVAAYLVMWIFFLQILHVPLYEGVVFEFLNR